MSWVEVEDAKKAQDEMRQREKDRGGQSSFLHCVLLSFFLLDLFILFKLFLIVVVIIIIIHAAISVLISLSL